MSDINISMVPQGWQCPVCGRVYSPSTVMCLYCNNGSERTVTGTDNTTSSIKILTSNSVGNEINNVNKGPVQKLNDIPTEMYNVLY